MSRIAHNAFSANASNARAVVTVERATSVMLLAIMHVLLRFIVRIYTSVVSRGGLTVAELSPFYRTGCHQVLFILALVSAPRCW